MKPYISSVILHEFFCMSPSEMTSFLPGTGVNQLEYYSPQTNSAVATSHTMHFPTSASTYRFGW